MARSSVIRRSAIARTFALAMGAAYLLGGILGAVLPGAVLGVFLVNAVHNLIHMAVGAIWLIAALAAPLGANSARLASQAIGLFFLVVGFAGLAVPDVVDSLIVINLADNLLHLATGIVATYVGFTAPRVVATT